MKNASRQYTTCRLQWFGEVGKRLLDGLVGIDVHIIFQHEIGLLPALIRIPAYLDVWLWLWREKKKRIHTRYYYGGLAVSESSSDYGSISHADPEEAIIAAIEYLVENDLIK